MAHETQTGPKLTVRELYEEKRAEWNLELLTGEGGLDREITTFELNRPGLALAGYYDLFSVERVQFIGLTETTYLESLSPVERRWRIQRTMEFPMPCLIITRGLPALPEMIEVMRELQVPLLRTDHITSPFQAEIGTHLERRLAPRWSVHGVMMEIFGLGVLIRGKSGVGKSECALDLLQRGHLLVADDVVMMRRVTRGKLFAEPSPTLEHHMEIRGVGIIDIKVLFGIRAVTHESELSLIVELERWDPGKEYERLGLRDHMAQLFGCKVPLMTVPVEPGRNLAQLIEVAALSQRLKLQGVNIAAAFEEKISTLIKHKAGDEIDPITRLTP